MPTWNHVELEALQRGWHRGHLALTLPVDCPHCIHPDGDAFVDVIVPAVVIDPGGGGGGRGGGGGAPTDADTDEGGPVVGGFPDSFLVECRCTDEEHGDSGGCGRRGRVRTAELG